MAEVAVSVFLMAISAIGVAQLFTIAARANLNAKSQTSTAVYATQKMEQLRSLAWGYEELAGGGVGNPITDLQTNLSVDPPAGNGPGLAPTPPDVLDRNIPPYVDYLDAQGGWIGTGATAPPGTVYVRRWSIEPLPANPNDTLVFQVVVIPNEREARRNPSVAGRLRDETRLVSLKTRKAS